MKTSFLLAVMFALSFAYPTGPTLTNDPLTGLPLFPFPDPYHLGNAPSSIPSAKVCKSQLKFDLYEPYSTKVDSLVSWYFAHLAGFKRTHAYANGRSQDFFYNANGTLVVAITGNPGKEGEDAGGYGIVYVKIQPGLPEKSIVGMNQQKVVCP